MNRTHSSRVKEGEVGKPRKPRQAKPAISSEKKGISPPDVPPVEINEAMCIPQTLGSTEPVAPTGDGPSTVHIHSSRPADACGSYEMDVDHFPMHPAVVVADPHLPHFSVQPESHHEISVSRPTLSARSVTPDPPSPMSSIPDPPSPMSSIADSPQDLPAGAFSKVSTFSVTCS